MKLYFFTAGDENYRHESNILIKSGKYFGREIHFFDMPKGEDHHRYRLKLLADPDFPKADKYIYLDSDTVMTGPGDWEREECRGVFDVFYYVKDKKKRIRNTMGFIRNHTSNIGEGKGCEYICELWRLFNYPPWCNSGVIVLKAGDRISFTRSWLKWMNMIDKHCEKGHIIANEAPLMFANLFYDMPFLPPRFNGIYKNQPIHDWHVLIHADGKVSGEKKIPYTNAVKRIQDE